MPNLRYIYCDSPGETKRLPPQITPVLPHPGVPPPPIWGRAGRVLHISLCEGLG
nr:MAG TPA: hypothetical protein [Caudoviricetes sp.]